VKQILSQHRYSCALYRTTLSISVEKCNKFANSVFGDVAHRFGKGVLYSQSHTVLRYTP